MKKQLLVLIFAFSAIGSAYAGDEDVDTTWNFGKPFRTFTKNYARPIQFLYGLGEVGGSALFAIAAYKKIAQDQSVESLNFLGNKLQPTWNQIFVGTSTCLGLNGALNMYDAIFGCKYKKRKQKIG